MGELLGIGADAMDAGLAPRNIEHKKKREMRGIVARRTIWWKGRLMILGIPLEQLPPKAREQIAQKMLRENKKRIATSATPPRNDSGNGEAKSKYGNKKAVRVLANGKEFRFDSQKEARRFDELLVLLQAGKIKDLKLQPEFTLREAYTDPEGWHIRPLKYRADFSYMERVTPVCGGQGSGRPTGAEDSWGFCAEQWRYVVEDVKSYATKTRVYEMKKQMMLEKFKIRIREA